MRDQFYVMSPSDLFLTGYSIESEPVYMSNRSVIGSCRDRTKADLLHKGMVVNASTYEEAAETIAPMGDFKPYHVIVVGKDGAKLVHVEPSKRARGKAL